MARKPLQPHRKLLAGEHGTLHKTWAGRIRVALVYPNSYAVGMSSLGFQTVYGLLNALDEVVCERAFLPDPAGPQTPPPITLESGQPLGAFDVVAFSVSFENDYPNILTLLQKAGLPLHSRDRGPSHPLVMAGGVACFLNPEPLAPFIDLFMLGEAEEMLPPFFGAFEPAADRRELLMRLARTQPGLYVPACYHPSYHADGSLQAFTPVADVPPRIRRVFLPDLAATATCSSVVTPHTTFARTYLIETGRGCPHGCRFCSAGYIYRPPRFRPLALLEENLRQGAALTDRIGLVGAAVSDLPEIGTLCSGLCGAEVRISFSSLRADALTPELIAVLQQSQVKTATIAPDAGSERMRRVINKGIDEASILAAAETLVAAGIPNLKLYFMVGLPSETPEDVAAIVALCKRIKHHFLTSSRSRGRIGELTVSLNSFVPKPATPFQWVAMDEVKTLKSKIRQVTEGLKKVPNVRVHADVPRWAFLQALLSRGDRRVAQLLEAAAGNGWNWPQTFKWSVLNPGFYVTRERPLTEVLPWDFIDHGVRKAFLEKEYQRALGARTSPDCPMDGACSRCGACSGPAAAERESGAV
ncbi:MAG: radical SAM protein [Desulfobacterales bacterium]